MNELNDSGTYEIRTSIEREVFDVFNYDIEYVYKEKGLCIYICLLILFLLMEIILIHVVGYL